MRRCKVPRTVDGEVQLFQFDGNPCILRPVENDLERLVVERFECERMFIAVLDTGSFAAAARRQPVWDRGW